MGHRGVFAKHSTPLLYFADYIHDCDMKRFSASPGESGHTTLQEVLAILDGVRQWRSQVGRAVIIGLRSHSLGLLPAIREQASKSPTLR